MGFRPFIYGLFDPAEVGHIRYVGMAGVYASRPYDHAKNARKSSTQPSHLVHWIRKIQSEGREPAVLILEELSEGAQRSFVGEIEKMYITSLRSIGHRLTNISDGGASGPPTTETRQKISATLTGRKNSEESKAKMRATWATKKGQPRPLVSAETRAKLSAGNKRRVIADSARVNMSKAGKGRKKSEETRARMCAAQAGRIITPEARIKISATLTGRKASEETRAKMVASRAAYLERKSKLSSAEESTT